MKYNEDYLVFYLLICVCVKYVQFLRVLSVERNMQEWFPIYWKDICQQIIFFVKQRCAAQQAQVSYWRN